MKRLIVLEGADRSGKSTQAKLLHDWMVSNTDLSVKFMRQPSDDNSLGFLRDIVKGNSMELSSFERQLLHTCSHIVDAYQDHDIIIMDRCYISALVYGSLTGMNVNQYDLISKIHSSVYESIYKDRIVDIFLMNRQIPLTEKDDSFYENRVNWEDIRNLYEDLFETAIETGKFFISPFESKRIIRPTGNQTEVLNSILDLLKR